MSDAYKLAPLASFVMRYGLGHFQASMQTLYEMSKRSYVAQVAIRSFIVDYPQDTLVLLHQWALDENDHVRCLVSGGSRPRLRLRVMPGVNKLMCFIEDPVPLLTLLERMKDDLSYSVRRSVSGNLSDVIKDNPDTAYATMAQWQKGASKQALQVIRNALKHSVKKGDQRAIELFSRCVTSGTGG
jgi:3-methyladenine DNA glycosylase AlkC